MDDNFDSLCVSNDLILRHSLNQHPNRELQLALCYNSHLIDHKPLIQDEWLTFFVSDSVTCTKLDIIKHAHFIREYSPGYAISCKVYTTPSIVTCLDKMVAPRYSEQVEKIKQFGAIGSDVAIIPEKNILTCMSAMLMGPDVMTLSMITTVAGCTFHDYGGGSFGVTLKLRDAEDSTGNFYLHNNIVAKLRSADAHVLDRLRDNCIVYAVFTRATIETHISKHGTASSFVHPDHEKNDPCPLRLVFTENLHFGKVQDLFGKHHDTLRQFSGLRVPKQVILPDTELSEERAVPPVTYRSDIKNVLDNAAEYNSLLHRMIFESKGISSLERCFRADIASRTTAQVQKASNSLRYHHIVELFMFSAILPSYSNIHSNK